MSVRARVCVMKRSGREEVEKEGSKKKTYHAAQQQ